MGNDIDRIINNSNKAEILEMIEQQLPDYDKVLVIMVKENEDNQDASQTLMLGIAHDYEAYGLLEYARQDISNGS